jgi:hypothetical protein
VTVILDLKVETTTRNNKSSLLNLQALQWEEIGMEKKQAGQFSNYSAPYWPVDGWMNGHNIRK